jgi:endonuclease/exonuclease/phosphatase family metal-dependent hydrolase
MKAVRVREARALETREWRPVALSAGIVVLGLQSIRVLIPVLYNLRERSGAVGAMSLAVLVFLSPLAGPLIHRVSGRGAAPKVVVGGLVLSGVAMQVLHPIPLWLAAVSTAVGFLAWTLSLQALRTPGRSGGSAFAVGLLIGLSVDASVHAAFRTWDFAWQRGTGPLVVALALAAGVAALVPAIPRIPAHGDGRFREVLPLALLGPFVMLEVLFLQNVAFAAAATGLSLPGATAVVLLGALLAVALVLALRTVRVPLGARFLGGAVLTVLAWFLPAETGWVAVASILVAQPLASALVAMGLTRGEGSSPGFSGTWRLPVAMSLGSLAFLALMFLYQIHIDDPLPVPRQLLPAAAGVLLALAAFGGEPSFVVPQPRWAALVAPAVALVVVPLGLLLTLPVLAVSPEKGRAFRMLDYNVHSGVDGKGQVDPERLARVIEAQHPDLVLLQEISRGWVIAGTTDDASWLSYQLHMPFAWAPAADGQFGNLLLSRFPILRTDAVLLPYGAGPQHRSYLRVELDVGGGRVLTVIGTHLQNTPGTSTRRDQIRAVLDAWGKAPFTLIAGDMNTQPTEADIEAFARSGLTSAQDATGHRKESTARDPNHPGDRVDWIFGTRDLRFGEFAIVHSEASDHLPVAVSVTLT